MRRHVAATGFLVLTVVACSTSACASRSTARGAGKSTPTYVASARPAPPSASSPAATRPRRCGSKDLRLSVAASGSVMSQPYADISITNLGPTACRLSGYPRIAAAGYPGASERSGAAKPVRIRVFHRIMERVDPGPRLLVVKPRHRVFFSVGTADAYDGPLVTLTSLTVTFPDVGEPLRVDVRLLANGPHRHEIPIGVTGLTRLPHA